MPNELNPKDARNLWQSQEGEKVTISLEEIRLRATRLERRIWWRNFREYVAGAVGVIGFSIFGLRVFGGWALFPNVLMIAGMIYVIVQLHRRGSARSLPADADARSSIHFYRLELARQRDALRTVWRWYLLPFIPGVAALVAVVAIKRGVNARLIASIIGVVLVSVGIWALNEWAARKLNRKIEELQSMEGGNE